MANGEETTSVTLDLCNACLDGVGGECHTPGCALWMSQAPDISIRDKVVPELRTSLTHRIATLKDSVDNAVRGIALLGYPQAALCVLLQRTQMVLQDILKET